VCSLGGGAIQARAQTCGPVRIDAGLGQLASSWQEYDNQQRRLLRESGLLSVLQIGVQAECFGLGWEAGLHHAQGQREYVGNITTGGTIQTSSSIEQTELRVEGRKVIAPQWWLGGRLAYQQIERDLASAGAVLGYPELYRYWRAALGTGYRLWQGTDSRLLGDAWIGGGPGGRMLLRLPGDDPATLSLGSSRHVNIGLEWWSQRPPGGTPGWSWHLRLEHGLEQIEAGSAQAITRNGIVVGAALQPKTRISGTGLSASLSYYFY